MADYSDEDMNRVMEATNPAAKPRPDFTDAYADRTFSVGPEGPGFLSRVGSVARGAMDRAGELVSGAGDLAYSMSLAPGGRGQGFLEPRSGGLDSGAEVARTMGEGADAIGAREATDKFGRSLETAGSYMTDAAVMAPMVAASAPALGVGAVPAVLAEMGFAGLGGLVDGTLSEEGHPLAGSALGVVGSAGAGLGAIPISKSIDAAKGTVRAFRKMTEDAIPYMQKLGVTRDSLVRASSEIKRDIPDIPAAIEQLDKVIKMTDGRPGNVSPRQAFEAMPNNRGGSAFSHMGEQLSRTDKDYRREAALSRADFLDSIAEDWDDLVKVDPDFPAFIAKYDEGQTTLKLDEREAWKVVRQDEQPTFDISDLRESAADIIEDKVFKRGDVPRVFHDLLDEDLLPSTTVDLNRFQELRSVLLGVVRDAKVKPESANKHAASMASELLEKMQTKMDDWAASDLTGKSAEFAKARRLTFENNDLYDLSSPVIGSLEKGGRSRSLFSRIRSAQGKRGHRTTPEDEARRLVRIAEQSPGGMDNLRSLALEDLFFDGLIPTATKVPTKKMEQSQKMYRVILGDTYDDTMELMELSRLGVAGKEGTSAQVSSTGSGVSPAKFLFGLARDATNPIEAVIKHSMDLSGSITKDQMMWQAIVREALSDKKFTKVLLEMPTERALPAWQVEWKKLLAKAGTRSAARAAARKSTEETGTKP